MKNFIVRDADKETSFYEYDIEQIVRVLKRNGYNCSKDQAKLLWQKYSDSMAAGWMILPDEDGELLGCVLPYIITYDEDPYHKD